jgi:hypothetical protein
MADAPKILGTDTLRDAYPKLNSAIDNSNEAKTKADGADGKADTAIETANTAKTTADTVQSQFDQVVAEAGENNPEVVQARGEAVNLNARLNATDAQLAEKVPYEKARLKSVKLEPEDLSEETLGLVTGTGTVNLLTIPQEDSVTLDKIKDSALITDYVAGDVSSNLPVKTSGKYEVSLSEKSDLYISNGNLIDIVGIDDGTYTANGLTIVIADNRITITGTSSVAQYFKISGDTGFVAGSTGLNVRSYPLPINDKYTFGGYNIVNTQSPAFTTSIRSTVSGNYAQFNLTDTYPYDELTDLSKFGEMYSYLPAGTYDCAFSLFLMPTAYDSSNAIAPNTNKLSDVSRARVDTSKSVLSTVSGTAKNLINVFENLNPQQPISEKDDLIYVESYSTYFNFYIKGSDKDSNKYLKYTFEYWDGQSFNNGKGWVLGVVDAVEKNGDTFTTLYPVVKAGEWEMALRIKGRPDFIGCKQHGSEINFYEKFYIDGTQWLPDNSSFWCEEIKVIEKSTMYDPADETTVVGTHIKDYKIKVEGLKIRQKILWSTSQIMDLDSYVAMLPIIRGNDATTTYQITAKAYNDDSYEEIDVSNASHGARTAQHEPDKWTLYSNSTGISANIQSIAKEKTAGATSFVQNSASYNKVYFSYCGTDYNVSPGDVWENEITYELNINS